jgi:hypothetical protein
MTKRVSNKFAHDKYLLTETPLKAENARRGCFLYCSLSFMAALDLTGSPPAVMVERLAAASGAQRR